jgi:hypothetical protein
MILKTKGPYDAKKIRQLINIFEQTKTDEDMVDTMWLLYGSYVRVGDKKGISFVEAVEQRDDDGVVFLKFAAKHPKNRWPENGAVRKALDKAEARPLRGARLQRLAEIAAGRLFF